MNCLTLLAHCHRTGTFIRFSSNSSVSNTNPSSSSNAYPYAYPYANVSRRIRVQNVMEASLYDRSPVRTVITPEAMQELLETSCSVYHVHTLHEDNDNNDNNDNKNKCCPITQSEFADGDAVLMLPCGHVYMQDAIQTWLEKERAECPVCRHPLPSHEIIP